jgi:DNA-binding MarR family transcriptional regulator
MTRLLKGLERDGHVQRSGVAGDRRAVRVRATARARRALAAARARRHEALRERLAALSPAEWRRVEAALAVLEPHLVT